MIKSRPYRWISVQSRRYSLLGRSQTVVAGEPSCQCLIAVFSFRWRAGVGPGCSLLFCHLPHVCPVWQHQVFDLLPSWRGHLQRWGRHLTLERTELITRGTPRGVLHERFPFFYRVKLPVLSVPLPKATDRLSVCLTVRNEPVNVETELAPHSSERRWIIALLLEPMEAHLLLSKNLNEEQNERRMSVHFLYQSIFLMSTIWFCCQRGFPCFHQSLMKMKWRRQAGSLKKIRNTKPNHVCGQRASFSMDLQRNGGGSKVRNTQTVLWL